MGGDEAVGPGPESFVVGSEKLTSILGHWPAFGDAEVIDLHLWRGRIRPKADEWVFPVLTVKLHVLEWSSAPRPGERLEKVKNTLVTLRFHGIEEDLILSGFNHQNAILELVLGRKERSDGPSPCFAIEFVHAFGMRAAFTCAGIEVVEALPCSEDGLVEDH